jgi:hypothetical protein
MLVQGTKSSALDTMSTFPSEGPQPIAWSVGIWRTYYPTTLAVAAQINQDFFVTVMRGNQTKLLNQGPFCIQTEIFFSFFHIAVLIITGCHLSSPSADTGSYSFVDEVAGTLTFKSLLVTWYTNRFNIQQLYALPTPYSCVLYLSENEQRLAPLTA